MSKSLMTLCTALQTPADKVFDATFLRRTREVLLKENLFALRMSIKRYRNQEGRYPNELKDLVERGYLSELPADPFTETSLSWAPVYGVSIREEANDRMRWAPIAVVDVHSGASGLGLNGVSYRDW